MRDGCRCCSECLVSVLLLYALACSSWGAWGTNEAHATATAPRAPHAEAHVCECALPDPGHAGVPRESGAALAGMERL